MASVVKRGGTWYARWKDAAGRRRSEKTVCTTRKDAQRFADDLERKAERQRHGLEPLHEEGPPMTFSELFEWWLREYAAHQRSDCESFYRKRLLPGLGKLPLQEVTSAKLEGLLQSHARELSPKSLNELRGAVYNLFRRATQRGLWHGVNPAAGVEKRKVPRKLFDTLRAEEVPLVLAALKSHLARAVRDGGLDRPAAGGAARAPQERRGHGCRDHRGAPQLVSNGVWP